jgi:hypothetical protein
MSRRIQNAAIEIKPETKYCSLLWQEGQFDGLRIVLFKPGAKFARRMI